MGGDGRPPDFELATGLCYLSSDFIFLQSFTVGLLNSLQCVDCWCAVN